MLLETFQRWYTELLDYLDSTGDEYIIAMDNASYHTKKLVPKTSDNKQTYYDWLKKYESHPGVQIELPDDIKKIRKWEMQEMVGRVVALPSMETELFTLDKITAARGHRVLRLPPYNCDLNVIGELYKLHFYD